MQFKGKKINQSDFLSYMNDLVDKDTNIDLSYFEDKNVMPLLEEKATNKKLELYACFLREYEGVYTFRYFTRTIRYSNGKRKGLRILYDFTREFERVYHYQEKYFLSVNNLTSYYSGFNILPDSTVWEKRPYNYNCYTYYGKTRKYNVICNYIDVKCDMLKNLENAKKDIFENSASTIEQNIFGVLRSPQTELAYKCGYIVSDYSYLEEFSLKQISFACRNNLYSSLPLIKYFETYEADTIKKIYTRNYYRDYNYDVEQCQKICNKLKIDKFRLLAFIRRVEEFDTNIMLDLIDALEELNYDLKRALSVNYRQLHDEYIEMARKERERKRKELDEKMKNNFSKAMQILDWINRKDKYTVIVPNTIEAYKNEGKIQNICVYSMGYYRKVYNHKSIILFIRENKNIEKPYVCVELKWEDFSVLQCRGKANSKPKEDVIEYVNNLSLQLKKEAQAHAWA